MGPDTYTVDEIDSFTVPQLKKILKDMGVRCSTAGKDWRRPKLREEVIARAGPSTGGGGNPPPPAQGGGNPPPPAQDGGNPPPPAQGGGNPPPPAPQQQQQTSTNTSVAWTEVMDFFAGCGIGQQEGALFAT